MRRTRRWTVRSSATLVVAVVLLGGLPAPASASASQAEALGGDAFFEPPADEFAWSVPDRFGPDDGDGIVDYHWKPRTGTVAPRHGAMRGGPVPLVASRRGV